MTQPGFLGGHATVDEFTQDALKRILQATKISNDLPGEKREDFDYYSTFPEFRKIMAVQGKKIREMIKSQFSFQGIRAGVAASQVEDLVDLLTDANDTILERINMNLDEAAGLKRDVNPLLLEVSQSNVSRVSGSWNNFDRSKTTKRSRVSIEGVTEVKLLAAKNVLRPQVKFKQFIDNSSKPFTPRLTEKPNSKKPLSILVEYDDKNEEFFSHPYLFELDHFTPSPAHLQPRRLGLSKSVDAVKMEYVDTKDKLVALIDTLKKEAIIAVDLEAHTYRSYLGFVCLVQISTEQQDYLIDPFNMWADMSLLNEVTTDPSIVKVFHGCDSDVVWLQRDFSVYLVNVFDTHQAGKLLGLPRLSLAWLLEHYCKIYADKQYQLADWRIRPLPEEMVYYARQDTRYLIYLYERLKMELLDKANQQENLLRSVIQQSNLICTTRYNKPLRTADSHLQLLKKSKSVLNNKQIYALQEIYLWRDHLARQEDESSSYVLPNHMLLKICTELPREMQGILACCNPVPPLVKQHLQTLHLTILKARNKPLQAVSSDLNASVNTDLDAGGGNEVSENPLQCPLDLSNVDLCSGLTTLVNPGTDEVTLFICPQLSNNNMLKKRSDLGVFDIKQKRRKKNVEIRKFISPFQRYMLLKPYLDSLNAPEEPSANAPTQAKSDDLRLESIKLHFQKLTEMTPKPRKVEKAQEEEEEKEVVDEGEISDEEVVPIRRGNKKKEKGNSEMDPKREKILAQANKEIEQRKLKIENKLVQEEILERKKKKRKSTEPETFVSKVPKQGGFDYEHVDFNKMFENGQKRPPPGGGAAANFYPSRSDRKDRDTGKKKQKAKNTGKSFTFKS